MVVISLRCKSKTSRVAVKLNAPDSIDVILLIASET